MAKYMFTFGLCSRLRSRYVVVDTDGWESARQIMMNTFGREWAAQYDEPQWRREGQPMAERYNLTELVLDPPLPPPSLWAPNYSKHTAERARALLDLGPGEHCRAETGDRVSLLLNAGHMEDILQRLADTHAQEQTLSAVEQVARLLEKGPRR